MENEVPSMKRMLKILLLLLLQLCPRTVAESKLASGTPTISSSSLVTDSCYKTNGSSPSNSLDWSLLKLNSTSLLTSVRFTGIQYPVDVLVGDDFISSPDLSSFQLCVQYSPSQNGTNVSCLAPVMGSVLAIRAKDVDSPVRLCTLDAFGFATNMLKDDQVASVVLDGDVGSCVELSNQWIPTLELQLPQMLLDTFWIRVVRPIQTLPPCGFDPLQIFASTTSKQTNGNEMQRIEGPRCAMLRQTKNSTIIDFKCECNSTCTGPLTIAKTWKDLEPAARICEVTALAPVEPWTPWSSCSAQCNPINCNKSCTRNRSRTCSGSCQTVSVRIENCTTLYYIQSKMNNKVLDLGNSLITTAGTHVTMYQQDSSRWLKQIWKFEKAQSDCYFVISSALDPNLVLEMKSINLSDLIISNRNGSNSGQRFIWQGTELKTGAGLFFLNIAGSDSSNGARVMAQDDSSHNTSNQQWAAVDVDCASLCLHNSICSVSTSAPYYQCTCTGGYVGAQCQIVPVTQAMIQSAANFFNQSGRADYATMLLQNTGNVSAKVNGSTPLHMASSLGNFDAVRVLLSRGANLEEKDDTWDDFTALLWASRLSYWTVNIVQLLVDMGANVNARDRNNRTPMWYATYGPYWNTAIVRDFLTSRGGI